MEKVLILFFALRKEPSNILPDAFENKHKTGSKNSTGLLKKQLKESGDNFVDFFLKEENQVFFIWFPK